MDVKERIRRREPSANQKERAVSFLRAGRVHSTENDVYWLVESDSGQEYTVICDSELVGNCNCKAGIDNVLCVHLLAVAVKIHAAEI